MKIELQSSVNYYTPYADLKKQPRQASLSRPVSRNFDGITIQSDQEISQERKFADALSSRLSMEIKKPTASSQVQNLQKQIEDGSYEVDINQIADRIMLC